MNAALALPGLLLDPIDRMHGRLLQPDQERQVDFRTPPGEPALSPPDSVSWRVYKNPVALFIGGVAAVILELGEPRVRAGVWDHSSFRREPLRRLQRTGLAAMVTIYGARSRAEAMIAGVVLMHDKVRGVASDGQAYVANDQPLLDWVFATAGYGFGNAYSRYVRALTPDEFDRLYAEGEPSARLYGAVGAPLSGLAMEAALAAMTPSLAPSPELDEFLQIMSRRPLLPAPLQPLQASMVRAAVDLTPPRARERLGLSDRWRLAPWERGLIRQAGRMADRLVLRSSPAVQACERFGLPADYLYRR